VFSPATSNEPTRRAQAIYFGLETRLAGWYHAPLATVPLVDCAVVLCAPLGYEALCVHRALRHWAIALANAGVATLRFDYDGTGNSAGDDTGDHRVEAWIRSIADATAELRSRTGARNVVLAGVRLGGTLAMAAAPRAGADGLIVFASHATGRSYVRELRAFGRLTRAAVTDEETQERTAEEAGGFVIERATLESLTSLDPLTTALGVRRALIVPRDDVATDTSVADRLSAQGVVVEWKPLPGYAAMMVDAHESIPPHAVIEASVRWLAEQYGTTQARASVSEGSSTSTADEGLVDGGVRERAVSFGQDVRLFGALAEPADPRDFTGTIIILANAGSVHHVGPGRMYVLLAREWARMGFSVLRMDLAGLGDSETRDGSADNHPYPDHAVDDLASAVRWCRERTGARRVIVAGLCSGAHASFHAGRQLDGVDGIIVINPIVFYWNPACALNVSAWMNYVESQRYSRSAREKDSWVRLLRGEVQVRHAASVAIQRGREVIAGALGAFARRLGIGRGRAEDVGADLARISARGVTTLLLFSEGDPGLDFVRRRYARDVRLLERDRRNFAMRVIPSADHTFTRAEARDRLRQLLTTHLMERHRV
jgi:predicted alpha/beta hydrolase